MTSDFHSPTSAVGCSIPAMLCRRAVLSRYVPWLFSEISEEGSGGRPFKSPFRDAHCELDRAGCSTSPRSFAPVSAAQGRRSCAGLKPWYRATAQEWLSVDTLGQWNQRFASTYVPGVFGTGALNSSMPEKKSTNQRQRRRGSSSRAVCAQGS